jgi:hypothetical protein
MAVVWMFPCGNQAVDYSVSSDGSQEFVVLAKDVAIRRSVSVDDQLQGNIHYSIVVSSDGGVPDLASHTRFVVTKTLVSGVKCFNWQKESNTVLTLGYKPGSDALEDEPELMVLDLVSLKLRTESELRPEERTAMRKKLGRPEVSEIAFRVLAGLAQEVDRK